MRTVAVALLLSAAAIVQGAPRCVPRPSAQVLVVKSGEGVTLPAVAVPGATRYAVQRASTFTSVGGNENWLPAGNVSTYAVRPAAGQAPEIRERIEVTGNIESLLYVVTAQAENDPSFVPCSQDFLVTVIGNPLLTRDAQRLVIPVAGRVAGANGSFFTTRVTLYNPWSVFLARGRIVFHPSGRSALESDPSLSYELAFGESVTFDDIVAAVGGDGLGSLDIIPDGGLPVDVHAQLISASPGGGSFGTTLPVTGFELNVFGSSVNVTWPAAGKRAAFGIRTLAHEVRMIATLYAPDGSIRASFGYGDYPAEYHEQRPLADLFGVTPQPGDRIDITTMRNGANIPGGAVVYVAVTDNVTNDVDLILPHAPTGPLGRRIVACGGALPCIAY